MEARTPTLLVASTLLFASTLLLGAIAPSFAEESAPAQGAVLDVRRVVRSVLEHDPEVRTAVLEEAGARIGRELVRAQVMPQVSLGGPSPVGTIAWSRREILDQTAIPPAAVETTTTSAGALVSIVQALPTDGILSAGVESLMQVTDREDTRAYSQSLGFSASIQQPLFTNGKLVDLGLFDAGQELAAELPLRLAQSAADSTRNRRIIATLEHYVRVIELRREISVLERRIGTTSERIEQLRIRARQGTVTERTVWDNEITLDELREARLEAQYTLLQAEYAVASSIGVDYDLGEFDLSDVLPEIPSPPPEDAVLSQALESNPSVDQARELLEQRRLQRVVNGRQYAATLSAQFSLSPAYPLDFDGAETFAESYSELFGENSTWRPSGSVSLSVPIYSGGQARLRRSQDETAVDRAIIGLDETRRGMVQLVRGLFLRRRLLEDQLVLRRSALTLQQERFAEQQTLAGLDSITDLELREAQTEVESRENAVWRTAAELLLNSLRIFDAAGVRLSEFFQEGEA